jgi:hypothetical protein
MTLRVRGLRSMSYSSPPASLTGVETMEEFLAGQPHLYTVFESPPDFWLPGDYALVFEGKDARFPDEDWMRGIAIGVVDGHVVSIALAGGAADPISSMLPQEDVEYLVEPSQ